ncbi:MAG: Gp138 family membrane-puncturing spike protein [Cetobacterium sp.]
MNNDIYTSSQLSSTIQFVISQRLLNINTMIPCEIVKIKNDSTIDVRPLNKEVNADGTLEDPPVIFNVPVMQITGNNNLIFIELKQGDIGLVGFCHRDISSMVKQKKSNKPPTKRMFSLSDGIWIGGLFKSSSEVQNKIEIKDNTITIDGSNDVEVLSKNITINANIKTKIIAGGINIVDGIKDLADYIQEVFLRPSAPGNPPDASAPARIAVIKSKFTNFS